MRAHHARIFSVNRQGIPSGKLQLTGHTKVFGLHPVTGGDVLQPDKQHYFESVLCLVDVIQSLFSDYKNTACRLASVWNSHGKIVWSKNKLPAGGCVFPGESQELKKLFQ